MKGNCYIYGDTETDTYVATLVYANGRHKEMRYYFDNTFEVVDLGADDEQ